MYVYEHMLISKSKYFSNIYFRNLLCYAYYFNIYKIFRFYSYAVISSFLNFAIIRKKMPSLMENIIKISF